MTNLPDAWFLLQHSAHPLASAGVFFLLGLWFAYLLWHRWVRHLHLLQRENLELEEEVKALKNGSSPDSATPPGELQKRLRAFFGGGDPATDFSHSGIPSKPADAGRAPRPPQVQALLAAASAAFAARTRALDGKA